MEALAVELLLLVFGVWVFSTGKYIKGNNYNIEYLSKDNTTEIRGIMAITIMLYHLVLRVGTGVVSIFYLHTGYLIVAMFFLLSGYGLMFQFMKKGERYLKGFGKNRILPLVLIYALVTVIYVIVEKCFGADIRLSYIFSSIGKLAPVVINSWYVIEQIMFYIFFWIVFKCSKKRYVIGVLVVFALQTLFNVCLYVNGYNLLLFTCNYSFSLGLIWAIKKDEIEQLLRNRKNRFICILVAANVFLIFSGMRIPLERMDLSLLVSLCKIITGVVFCILVLLVNLKISFQSEVWKWLGGISLEIYLFHGLFMYAMRNDYKTLVESNLLYMVLTVVLTVIFSYLFHFITSFINKSCKQNWIKS